MAEPKLETMGRATRPAIGPVVALLFLIPPPHAESSDTPVLRYAVRADPFEVELTLPDGRKETTSPERDATNFYFVAESGWPVPEGPDAERVRCEIRWKGFPTDWRLVNSFGIDRRTQKFQATLGELRKAVFAGGDFRTARSKKGLLLVTRDRWEFPDADAVELLDRIAEAHAAVWRDRGLAGHIVYLLGTDESAGHWQGEARTRSMVLQASRKTAAPEDVAFGFAHELFHEWNSRRLNRSDDERLYWFTEGLTDYYATMTLWRAGIWNLERMLDNFNTAARQYFGSPVRNYTADRMVERRKSDMNAERLPYLQGFLLASHWNTDGHILDQGMRNLLKSNRTPLSNERIADALEAAGVRSVRSEIARFVTRGETIELRPRIWGDCARESRLGVKQFDAGFDVDESRKTGTIRGLREASTAWDAGVREGQRWAPMDVVWGDPTYLAEIEIRDGQGARHVKYYPASSSTVEAPQYTAIPARPCVSGSRVSP